MFKKLGWLAFLVVSGFGLQAQNRPKLVVGIVVDQMRYDYLYRYSSRFSENGFKRLMRDGMVCHNTHYSYVPTYTAPGHASIYTGTTPAVHGIISNEWYSRQEGKMVYCTQDSGFVTIGSESGAGEMSPARLLCGTLGDAFKLFSQGQSKVFGVALKDRSAILPAGFSADGAFWFEGGKRGQWITSSYYATQLPHWAEKFNKGNVISGLLGKDWNTLYPLTTYANSGPDNNNFEGKFAGEDRPVFPHRLKLLSTLNGGYDILKTTPFGNTLTTEFAKELIDGEKLGDDEVPDLLAISYSSTDYVGHKFGTNSVELEDTYLRLDDELGKFFDYLDLKIGRGEWMVFLTADHAGVEPPSFLASKRIAGGYFQSEQFESQLKEFASKNCNAEGLIENVSNNQIFLNADIVDTCQLGDSEIEQITDFIQNFQGIDKVVLSGELELFSGHDMYEKLKRGFHNRLSGDILYTLLPGWVEYDQTGSTHGSGYEYDTHVPLVFMGWGVKPGSTYEPVDIEDIAPTVSGILKITWPQATTGNPIPAVFK